jgi:hypothetical protein
MTSFGIFLATGGFAPNPAVTASSLPTQNQPFRSAPPVGGMAALIVSGGPKK